MFTLDDFKGYSFKGVIKKILLSEIENLKGEIINTDELYLILLHSYSDGNDVLFLSDDESEKFLVKYLSDFYIIFGYYHLSLDDWTFKVESVFSDTGAVIYATVETLVQDILDDFVGLIEDTFSDSNNIEVDDKYIKLFKDYVNKFDFREFYL